MSHSRQGIGSVWRNGPPVIGMVHLLPLPGSPRWGASMDAVVERATADAAALTEVGFDGIMVENFNDVPFLGTMVPAETVAAITASVLSARRVTDLPVGVNVLRNDARAALGIAAATGAHFIRVNVHIGSMWTDQGLVEGRAADTVRMRPMLSGDVAILADVHVKHATPPAGSQLTEAAADTWYRGLADALVVSGVGTGRPTEASSIAAARAGAPDAPVLVGSGVTPENARELLAAADGAIVGSSIMVGGRAGAGVDEQRARALIEAVRG